MVKTLTRDHGSELSGHQAFTGATGVPVYFCHPRSPWERPTNENTNGLLRDYFPKSVDLAGVQQADLDRAAYELNTRTATSTRLAHAGGPLYVVVCVHLLRPPMPKGTDLSQHSADELEVIQRSLNDRPRKTLGYMTPSEAYAQVVASTA